jgi:hypothetical protein
MGRLAVVIASLFLLGAVPAAAEAAAPVTSTVQKTVTVRAGGVTSVALRCPAAAVTLNGSAVPLGSGALARDSQPVGDTPGRWVFRFVASGDSGSRRARAVLRCVRLRLPSGVSGARLNVMSADTGFESVAAGTSRLFTLACDPGFVPTGWGVERRGAGARRLRVTRAAPTANGWVLQFENASSAAAGGRFHIRCLERRQTATTGQRHTFRTRRARFSEAGRRRAAKHSCRRSEFSVSTGFSVAPARDIRLVSAQPLGTRGARWRFDNEPARNKPVKTYLVCLDRTTGFR